MRNAGSRRCSPRRRALRARRWVTNCPPSTRRARSWSSRAVEHSSVPMQHLPSRAACHSRGRCSASSACCRAGFATRCTASWHTTDTDGSGARRRAWCQGPSFRRGFLTNHRLHRGSRRRLQNATKKRSAPANRSRSGVGRAGRVLNVSRDLARRRELDSPSRHAQIRVLDLSRWPASSPSA